MRGVCALAAVVAVAGVLGWPRTAARAHGGQPVPRALVFPTGPDSPWVLTDQQGLYARTEAGFSWLCEDAVAPNVGLQGLAVVDEAGAHWLVATDFGLYRSQDAGCSFQPLEGPLGGRETDGLWPHPSRRAELLVAFENAGPASEYLWRSLDGGETFLPVGVGVLDKVSTVLRASAAPDVLYITHGAGLARSADGGATLEPVDLSRLEVPPTPGSLTLLGTHPQRPDELYIAVERFPQAEVMRSTDGGRTFVEVVRTDDAARALVFDAAGAHALLTTWLGAWYRSEDGGESFVAEPATVADLGCLTRAPGTDAVLFGCTNVYTGGPWVVGRSEDLGRSWTVTLQRFQDVAERWGCAPESPAVRLCADLCPGEAFGAECGPQADADTDRGEDASPRDAEVSDVSVVGLESEEGGPAARSNAPSTGGCNARGTSGGTVPATFSLLACLAVFLVRRSRAAQRRGDGADLA